MVVGSIQELQELCQFLGCSGGVWSTMAPPEAARFTALQLWLNKAPETNESAELRRQLLYLSTEGQFDLL